MPPKARHKPTKGGKQSRQLAQFGELDTTPTSRQLQSPKNPPRSAVSKAVPALDGEFENELDDLDLIELDMSQLPTVQSPPNPAFNWSDADSLARRSSPAGPGETPRDIWKFDDDISAEPVSSPSGKSPLPDTVPLAIPALQETQQQPEIGRPVDFSETASTLHRSSPFRRGDAFSEVWDFRNSTAPNTVKTSRFADTQMPETVALEIDMVPHQALYQGNLESTALNKNAPNVSTPFRQDLISLGGVQQVLHEPTPPKSEQKPESDERTIYVKAKRTLGEIVYSELGSDNDVPSSLPRNFALQGKRRINLAKHTVEERDPKQSPPAKDTQNNQDAERDRKAKKRKQRQKPIAQFDETTQRVKDVRPVKNAPIPTRMPLVTALLNSTPDTNPTKHKTRKRAAPKSNPVNKRRKAVNTKQQGENELNQPNGMPLDVESHASMILPSPSEGQAPDANKPHQRVKVTPPDPKLKTTGKASAPIEISSDQATSHDDSSFEPSSPFILSSLEEIYKKATTRKGLSTSENSKPQATPRKTQHREEYENKAKQNAAPHNAVSKVVKSTPEELVGLAIEKKHSREVALPKKPQLATMATAGGHGHVKALQPRHPNIRYKPKVQGNEVESIESESPTSAPDPTTKVRKILKTRKPSRQISVSGVGSPVPISQLDCIPNPMASPLQDVPESLGSIFMGKPSHELAISPHKHHVLHTKSQAISGDNATSRNMTELKAGLKINYPNQDQPRQAPKHRVSSQQSRSLPRHLEQLNKKMHAQMLRTLQKQEDTPNPIPKVLQQEIRDRRKPPVTEGKASQDILQGLRGVVDVRTTSTLVFHMRKLTR